jgi:hypothetical protein
VESTLNGEILSAVLVSILDAAILSWIVLRWYRRSVLRLMRAPADAAPLEQPATSRAPASASTTPILITAAIAPRAGAAPLLLPQPPRRLGLAYLAGALAYSTVMTLAQIDFARDVPGAIATYLWINLWPVVPALALLFAAGWIRTVRIAALFVLCGSAFVAVVTLGGQIARGTIDSAPLTNVYWANAVLATTAYAPLALILLTGWRRIRGVFTMTLAATLCFAGGLLVFRRIALAMFDDDALRTMLLELAVTATADVAYYATYMLLAVPVGLVVWKILRWLGSAYQRKRFSDLQLVVDCWFALAAMETTVTSLMLRHGPPGIAIAVVAFAAYRLVVEVVLRTQPIAALAPERLLLLRVFGHQGRSETLFDHLARHWRFRGPVQLIVGGDLAMRTVDPGDVLAFVGGRLRTQYVASTEDVPARMERLDTRPDPDGRFRVNELYCLHDTWKATLRSLLAVTDHVVMDLRGFSRESQGCLYELEQIVTAIPSGRIVLIADEATDRPLLEHTLAQAWTTAHGGVTAASPGIDLVKVERSSRPELAAVMTRLLQGRDTNADGRVSQSA